MNSEFTKEYIRSSVNTFKNNEYRISDGLECSHIRTSYMEKMKDSVSQRIFADSEKYLAYAYEYTNNAMRIGDDLCARMQALSPEEFEGVLRPAYEADEWKLIVTGAVLGMGAGFMQLYLLFV